MNTVLRKDTTVRNNVLKLLLLSLLIPLFGCDSPKTVEDALDASENIIERVKDGLKINNKFFKKGVIKLFNSESIAASLNEIKQATESLVNRGKKIRETKKPVSDADKAEMTKLFVELAESVAVFRDKNVAQLEKSDAKDNFEELLDDLQSDMIAINTLIGGCELMGNNCLICPPNGKVYCKVKKAS